MNNIEKQLADFKAEQDKRFEEFKASITPKVEFEENIWWVTTLGSVYFINKIDGNRCYGFGISGGDWFNQGSHCAKYQLSHPASESEIKEALTKQIEKLGFTKGVEYKSMISSFTYKYKGNLKYISDEDKLVDNGECSIYHQGKFASIVKEEPKLTFGGYEVKIEKGVNHRAVITCQNIKGTYDQLKKIYDWFVNPSPLTFGSKKLEQFNLDGIEYQMVSDVPSKVKIGCTWGTMEEIKSILEACEKLS